MNNTYKVLSIDAWGNEHEGYNWNNWSNVGKITLPSNPTDTQILEAAFDVGYITQIEGGDIEDDQFNYIIVDKQSREPLFAIEYGSTI